MKGPWNVHVSAIIYGLKLQFIFNECSQYFCYSFSSCYGYFGRVGYQLELQYQLHVSVTKPIGYYFSFAHLPSSSISNPICNLQASLQSPRLVIMDFRKVPGYQLSKKIAILMLIIDYRSQPYFLVLTCRVSYTCIIECN